VPYIDLKKTSYRGASIPESNATENHRKTSKNIKVFMYKSNSTSN
jgi:hypothetical protein